MHQIKTLSKIKPWLSVNLFIFILAFFSLPISQMENFADDPGLGWHLATGRWILSRHLIPAYDPFLHSESPRAWVSDQWLSDIVLFYGYQIGGWPLLYSALAAVFAASFFILLPGLLRNILKTAGDGAAMVNPIMLSLTALLGFKLAQVHFILRPVVFNIPLFILVYAAMLQLRSSAAKTDFNKAIAKLYLILPSIFLLWVNIHGVFFLGLLLMAVFLLSAALHLLLKNSTAPWTSFQACIKTLGLFLLCSLLSLVNPYGAAIHKNILSYTSNSYFMSIMGEWQPLSLDTFEGKVFLLLAAALFVGAILSSSYIKGRCKIIGERAKYLEWSYFEPLSLLLFAYLSIDAVRILPFFAVVCSLPLAQILSTAFSIASPYFEKKTPYIHRIVNGVLQHEKRARGYILIPSLLCILLISYSVVFQSMPAYKGSYGPSRKIYPFAALDYLMSNELKSGQKSVLAAHPNLGGFITWKSSGQVKALIDDRNRMLGQSFYEDYFNAFEHPAGLISYLSSLGATHLLIDESEPAAASLSELENLKILFRKDSSLLFRIVRAKNRAG